MLYNNTFLMVYAGAAVVALIGSCYLLLRRANAFAPDVNPPLRVRRLAAAFCASMVLSHVWWYEFYYSQPLENLTDGIIICSVLDFLTTFPLVLCTMFAMLQDRRRKFWPILVAMVLLIVPLLFVVAFGPSLYLLPIISYIIQMSFIIFIMVRAVREYGRWLRDNYADLENKEVWKTFVFFAMFLLISFFYGYYIDNILIDYILQFFDVAIVVMLVWRVENLQTLEEPAVEPTVQIVAIPSDIASMLKQHCEDTKMYLNHDITLAQLAARVCTNRYYLSQHFAKNGMNYNSYINGLRIRYFTELYRQAVAAKRAFTARQLAFQSGFRSYSTFGVAFKQSMGETVTEWMK